MSDTEFYSPAAIGYRMKKNPDGKWVTAFSYISLVSDLEALKDSNLSLHANNKELTLERDWAKRHLSEYTESSVKEISRLNKLNSELAKERDKLSKALDAIYDIAEGVSYD